MLLFVCARWCSFTEGSQLNELKSEKQTLYKNMILKHHVKLPELPLKTLANNEMLNRFKKIIDKSKPSGKQKLSMLKTFNLLLILRSFWINTFLLRAE